MLDHVLLITVCVLLLLVNAAGVVLVLLQLPGTWLILAATSAVAWWRWEHQLCTWWTLAILVLLAILGEVVEFLGSAVGAAQVRSSKRAVLLAIVGGVVGAVVGTVLLAFGPVLGTLIGAVVGSGLGSMLGDLWAGRQMKMALRSGQGAAVGRFFGAVGKLWVAVLMWVVVLVGLVWV